MSQKALMRLIKLAKKLGIGEEDLDAEVHAAASLVASAINNDGLDSQIDYLLEQYGEAEVKAILIVNKQ